MNAVSKPRIHRRRGLRGRPRRRLAGRYAPVPPRRRAHRGAAGDDAGQQARRHPARQAERRRPGRVAEQQVPQRQPGPAARVQRQRRQQPAEHAAGAITVVVHEVLGNGLLRVAGEKSLYLNQGEEVMQVAGYVRASDVDGENRVSSQRIANARISYSGRGHLADANTPGWLMRWFVSGWSPL